MAIRFDWSPQKAKTNLRDHGISFDEAINVFLDPTVVILEDTDDEGEIRFHAIGYIKAALLALVVYVDRSGTEDDEVIRIISARKAEAFEEGIYAEQFA